MIMEAGASGPGASGILALMIAPQTMAKLFSLLFTHWMGFIYIILFFIALYFIIMVFFPSSCYLSYGFNDYWFDYSHGANFCMFLAVWIYQVVV